MLTPVATTAAVGGGSWREGGGGFRLLQLTWVLDP